MWRRAWRRLGVLWFLLWHPAAIDSLVPYLQRYRTPTPASQSGQRVEVVLTDPTGHVIHSVRTMFAAQRSDEISRPHGPIHTRYRVHSHDGDRWVYREVREE